MLWTQHRDRWEVAGRVARRIPYFTFKELTKDITAEDLGTIGRLNAKRMAGDTLTQEETDRLTAIASRWPVDDLRGACLVPPVSGDEVAALLDSLPRADASELERVLDLCATPEVPQDEITDPLAVQLIARGIAIDPADLTVGQGYAILAMPSPREG